ncbi:MAG: NACHT domain-containing protein [Polyangiaceae bacterium]|nr:NACHT domain-containing protein [Polyangiaceae bacterium]
MTDSADDPTARLAMRDSVEGPRNIRVPVVVIACSFGPDDFAGPHPRRARHLDGVERIAAAFEVSDPVVWEGDRAWLLFRPNKRVIDAWKVALELWKRSALELNLPTRVAVLFGRVDSEGSGSVREEDSRDAHALLDHAHTTEGVVNASEEIALSLPRDQRNALAWSGITGAGQHVYTFPADSPPDSAQHQESPLALWTDFEAYALSPEIREVHYVGFRLPRRAPPVLDLLDVFVVPAAAAHRQEGSHEPESVLNAQSLSQLELTASPLHAWLRRTQHLVVLGEPGSGKTTLLKWLAIVAAHGEWADLTGEMGPKLPILLSVGRLSECLVSDNQSYPEAIARYFEITDSATASAVRSFLDNQLRLGRCAVLLDGLDEVQAKNRALVEAWLRDFAAEFPRNTFVTTSRFVGYSGVRLPNDATVVQLAPLDARGREQFVRAFTRAYTTWETGENRPHDAKVQADLLLTAIGASERLSALATNPFMLSALALIHRAEGRLPRHRVQAYQMFVRALCETWTEARRLVPGIEPREDTAAVAYEEEAIPVLGELALEMHERYPRGVAPTEVVQRTIADALTAREENE